MNDPIPNEPIRSYHLHDAISASKLAVFHESPLDFYEQYVLRSRTPKSTWSLDMGECFHLLRHDPALLEANTVEMKFRDFRTDAAQEWRDAMAAEGKIILKTDEMKTLHMMNDKMNNHRLARTLVEGSQPELTWRKSFGKYSVQSRTDGWNPNGCTLPNGKVLPRYFFDYKVCDSLVQFRKSWTNLGYARKAVFYQQVITDCHAVGESDFQLPFFWIAITSSPPIEIQVYELGEQSFPVARGEVVMDLKSLRRCYETNQWERPEEIETIDYPFYAVKSAEKRLLEQRTRLELS